MPPDAVAVACHATLREPSVRPSPAILAVELGHLAVQHPRVSPCASAGVTGLLHGAGTAPGRCAPPPAGPPAPRARTTRTATPAPPDAPARRGLSRTPAGSRRLPDRGAGSCQPGACTPRRRGSYARRTSAARSRSSRGEPSSRDHQPHRLGQQPRPRHPAHCRVRQSGRDGAAVPVGPDRSGELGELGGSALDHADSPASRCRRIPRPARGPSRAGPRRAAPASPARHGPPATPAAGHPAAGRAGAPSAPGRYLRASAIRLTFAWMIRLYRPGSSASIRRRGRQRRACQPVITDPPHLGADLSRGHERLASSPPQRQHPGSRPVRDRRGGRARRRV